MDAVFDVSRFMPHGMCFLWRPDLLLLHVGSDLLIALAYFSIPTAILFFMRNRPDLGEPGVARLFVAFILLCGVTHATAIIVVWYPMYYIEGLFKLATALVSVTTAALLWPLMPRLIALPSTTQMELRNQEINELNERLEARIESLSTLAGGVAHDFNNLLTVMQGHVDLLQTGRVEGRESTSFRSIQESISRAESLCRQMLAYSGRGHFVLSELSLKDVFKEFMVRREDSPVVVELEELPSIAGETDQLIELVDNLVDNAIEALAETETGTPQVQVRAMVQEVDANMLSQCVFDHNLQPGRHVVLEVKDNAGGMDADTVTRMFEPYFSTKFVGRGLGLAAVQGIVRGHGGGLLLSTSESGTSFRVLFPIRQASATDAC